MLTMSQHFWSESTSHTPSLAMMSNVSSAAIVIWKMSGVTQIGPSDQSPRGGPSGASPMGGSPGGNGRAVYDAAVMIQAQFRGRQTRKLYEEQYRKAAKKKNKKNKKCAPHRRRAAAAPPPRR